MEREASPEPNERGQEGELIFRVEGASRPAESAMRWWWPPRSRILTPQLDRCVLGSKGHLTCEVLIRVWRLPEDVILVEGEGAPRDGSWDGWTGGGYGEVLGEI
jgi:hypothetical protein